MIKGSAHLCQWADAKLLAKKQFIQCVRTAKFGKCDSRSLVRTPNERFLAGSFVNPDLKRRSISPVITKAADYDNGKIESFNLWLTQEGALNPDKSPVTVLPVAEGLGLVATKNIFNGDELFSIPESLNLSYNAAKSSEIGKYLEGLKPWVALAIFLLHEKAKVSSKWRPYIDILPEILDLPVFW